MHFERLLVVTGTQAAFREHSSQVKQGWLAAKQEGEGIEGMGYVSPLRNLPLIYPN